MSFVSFKKLEYNKPTRISQPRPSIALKISDLETSMGFPLDHDKVCHTCCFRKAIHEIRSSYLLRISIFRMGTEVYATHNIAGNLTTLFNYMVELQ